MISRIIVATILGFLITLALPARAEHPGSEGMEHPATATAAKKVVTKEEIASGIQKHIDEQTKAGGGKFRFKDGDKELSLVLVKVHDDKLSALGDGSYFACVDFKGDDGNTYDVDFFLTGEPGAMSVTETSLHKVNGKPRYNWEKKADGAWNKVAVK
jgi:hypothetical protein